MNRFIITLLACILLLPACDCAADAAADMLEKDWHAAISKLEASRELFAEHPEELAYVDRKLAMCYKNIGKADEMFAAFERAVVGTSGKDGLAVRLEYINMLRCYGKSEPLNEAIDEAEEFIGREGIPMFELYPRQPTTDHAFDRAFWLMGYFERTGAVRWTSDGIFIVDEKALYSEESGVVKRMQVELFQQLTAEHLLGEARETMARFRIEKARKIIAKLKKTRISHETITFFDSAIDILERNWDSAAEKLELTRPVFSGHAEMSAVVDQKLAVCYGKLGRTDEQLDALRRAIGNTPKEEKLIPVSIAYIQALNAAGEIACLKEFLRDLEAKIGSKAIYKSSELLGAIFMREETRSAVQEHLENAGMTDRLLSANLKAVEYLVEQKMLDDARRLLKDAFRKNPDCVYYIRRLALIEMQEQNFDEAISLLDNEIPRRSEEKYSLLIDKTHIAGRMPAENAALVLQSVEKSLDELSEHRTYVLGLVGDAWLKIGDTENARRVYETFVEMAPKSIWMKVQLFDLARNRGDEPEMDRQMELIKTAKGEDSVEYRYVLAAKKFWLYTQKKATEEELVEAKTLLKLAEETWPNWPTILHILSVQAEIALMDGNHAEAIQCLQHLDELNGLTAQELEQLAKLLFQENRYVDVKYFFEKHPERKDISNSRER